MTSVAHSSSLALSTHDNENMEMTDWHIPCQYALKYCFWHGICFYMGETMKYVILHVNS